MQICVDNSHICASSFSTDAEGFSAHVENGRARLSEISDGKSDYPAERTATSKRAETAPTVPTLNEHRLAGRHNINPSRMELMMQSDTTTRPGGATTAIAPSLGAAYRSGAKSVDQLLVELADQFIADAKAIDPTITGGWLYRDLTAPERDDRGAVQGFYLEREHAPLCRKVGA